MSFEVGSRIFDYEVVGVLGAGGMGKVYKVRNVISDRMDAMKVLLPSLTQEPDLADRFLREIKVLASMSHPGIAAFYTALRYENQLIMVMELVNGITLSERLTQGPIPLQEGLAYMRQALSALGYAHRQGVIHRDIKPANMMLTPERTIKLMDFGIAKAANDPHLTRTGTTLGSLYYISPEALAGTGLDARSDLYSLGITMYEVVTGKRPFEGKSEYSLMAAHMQEAPQPPVELQANLPPSISAAILKALEKDPAKRFQTAEEFRAALEPAAPQLETRQPASTPQPQPIAVPPVSAAATIPIAPPQRAASHRGRYMLLGAVVAIILIVAAAVELPKWFRARATAGGALPAAQSTPVSATRALVPQSSAPQPAAQQSASPPAAAQAQTQTTQAAHPAQPVRAPEIRQARASGTEPVGRREARQHTISEAAAPTTGSPAANKREAAQSSTGASTQTSAQQAKEQAAALQALEDRMSQLSGRANAAKTTVANLQQQETSSGLSLRPDVLASESRMERYMDQADSALSAHNLSLAKHNMDLAEREISNLESFLGR